MAENYIATALVGHMRGTIIAGLEGRTYEVSRKTGMLHFVHGGMPVDEPRIHPDDVAEFQQFPATFTVQTAAAPVPTKAPPPPPRRNLPVAKSVAPTDQPGETPPPPVSPETKRADERALPIEAAAWSHARLITEATTRGLKLTAKEKALNNDKLYALIAQKVGVVSELSGADPDADPDEDSEDEDSEDEDSEDEDSEDEDSE